MHNYLEAQQVFPPGYLSNQPYVDGATDTAPGWGWASFILPFVESGTIYSTINFGLPLQIRKTRPPSRT